MWAIDDGEVYLTYSKVWVEKPVKVGRFLNAIHGETDGVFTDSNT